jgi:hypothetical protein
MNSPALVIAWSLWSRHRIGFIVAAVILAVLAITFPILVAITPAGAMALVSLAPVVGIFAFVLDSLLFVEDAGSLTSRYPRYMLTLPLRTRTLVFWPMLFVSVGAGLLWVAAALLIYRPAGYHAPVLIPALGLAGMMAWAQALAWMPMRLFWVREFATIILVMILGGIGALPVSLVFTGAGSAGLVAMILLTYITAAFLVAWAAVASDRHGIDWRFWPARSPLATFARFLPTKRPKRPFRSAFDAQLSYEWGCHGLMLNLFVSVILFVIWGVLLLRQGHGTPQWLAIVFALLPIVLVITIAATGTAFGLFRPFWSHQRGLAQRNTFIATRPMTSARLVAAKYRMAAASVLINWTLMVVGTTCWLVVSDNLDTAAILVRDFFAHYPGGKGVAVIVLTCILLPALSWRFLTGSLVPVLTGRRWVADGAVWLYLSLLAALGGFGFWLASLTPEQRTRLYPAIPFLVVGIVLVKGAAALAGFRAVLERRLMSWRNIGGVLGLWFVLSACGIALAILLGPIASLKVSLPSLALGVTALVPLARFPLATLAVDWNRHR